MDLVNLGLARAAHLKLYTTVEKWLQLKVKKFWGLNSTFVEVTGGELVGGRWRGGLFAPLPIVKRVKDIFFITFFKNNYQTKKICFEGLFTF